MLDVLVGNRQDLNGYPPLVALLIVMEQKNDKTDYLIAAGEGGTGGVGRAR